MSAAHGDIGAFGARCAPLGLALRLSTCPCLALGFSWISSGISLLPGVKKKPKWHTQPSALRASKRSPAPLGSLQPGSRWCHAGSQLPIICPGGSPRKQEEKKRRRDFSVGFHNASPRLLMQHFAMFCMFLTQVPSLHCSPKTAHPSPREPGRDFKQQKGVAAFAKEKKLK